MRIEEIIVSRLVEQRKHIEADRKLCHSLLCSHSFFSSAFFLSIISLMCVCVFFYIDVCPFMLNDAHLSIWTMFIPQTLSRLHLFYALNQTVSEHQENQSFCLCSVVKTDLPRGKYTNVSAQALLPFSLFFCLDVSSCNVVFSLPSCGLELYIFIQRILFFPLCDTHTHTSLTSWPSALYNHGLLN